MSVEMRPCAFCGHDCDNADLMDAIHRTLEQFLALAPPPPSEEYVEAWEEARWVLGVGLAQTAPPSPEVES